MDAHAALDLRNTNGICLLALDGGGVRGLSTLYILRDVMRQLNAERPDGTVLKPCDIFDLMCGTSTGGLIAIMLGRLEMDVDECIREYTQLMERVFREKINNVPVDWAGNIKAQYDSRNLRAVIEDVITRSGASPQDPLNDGEDRHCRVFVCATAKETLQVTRLRSYGVGNEDSVPATICKAALATAAATRFFDPVSIGNRLFVDGAFGANNPIEEVEQEAADIWSPTTRDLKPLIKCIVSIGTGEPGQRALDDNLFQFLTQTLVRMATKPEGIERRFMARWTKEYNEKRYFRFNVEKGLQDVRMTDYVQKPRIRDCVMNLVDKSGKPDLEFEDTIREHINHALRQKLLENAQARVQASGNHSLMRTQPIWMIPFERNQRFVDRDSLRTIKRKLFSSDRSSRMAIFGLGGVGKTQIALELAHQTKERWPGCSIFWIPAVDRESVQQAYRNIASQLGIRQKDTEEEDVKVLVQKHLSQTNSEQWLLIFDNADELDLWKNTDSTLQDGLQNFLPKCDQGTIVFTTRNKRVAYYLASTEIIHIREMDEQRAASVLRNSLVNKALLNDHEQTREILQHLTFLPLAIVQAASFINQNEMDLAGYMRLLDGQEQDVIDLLSEDFEDEGRYKSIRNPVATTWLTSFIQLQSKSSFAAECLSLMACINARDIPITILPHPSQLELDKALGLLGSYSFVRVRECGKFLDMHRLVHLAMRNWMRSAGHLHSWQKSAVQLLAARFPDPREMLSRDRNISQAATSHAINLLGATADSDHDFSWPCLSIFTSWCLYFEGRFHEAEKHLLNATRARDKIRPNDMYSILQEKQLQAFLCDGQGRYKEASELCEEILEHHQETYGDELLRSRVELYLSSIYYRFDRHGEANVMCRKALLRVLRMVGPFHPHSRYGIAVMANVYISQGQIVNASELTEQEATINRRVLGPDDYETIAATRKQAHLCFEQWRLPEAVALFREAFKQHQKIRGPENPETLLSMSFLASALKAQLNDTEAISMMAECARLREKVLGSNHLSTKYSYHELEIWEKPQNFIDRMLYRYTFYGRHEVISRRRKHYPRVKVLGGLWSIRRQPTLDPLIEEVRAAVKAAVKGVPLENQCSSEMATLVGNEAGKTP